MSRHKRTARLLAHVEEQMRDDMWRLDPSDDWAAPADGLTGLQHARAHRAAMSPERRAELDGEWA